MKLQMTPDEIILKILTSRNSKIQSTDIKCRKNLAATKRKVTCKMQRNICKIMIMFLSKYNAR